MQHCCIKNLYLHCTKKIVMFRSSYIITAVLLSMTLFYACDKDEPEIPNEEELITTLNYTLSPMNGGADVELSFVDLDGDGGANPLVTNGTLQANQTYEGTLELLNESESPAENITDEVAAEDLEHQFFFQSNASGVSVSYNDQDSEGNPLGVSSILTTGDATSGSLTITLRHEPNKSASGVSQGNISNAGGETDIEVTFTIDVQ